VAVLVTILLPGILVTVGGVAVHGVFDGGSEPHPTFERH
jgi:hypothetical protein